MEDTKRITRSNSKAVCNKSTNKHSKLSSSMKKYKKQKVIAEDYANKLSAATDSDDVNINTSKRKQALGQNKKPIKAAKKINEVMESSDLNDTDREIRSYKRLKRQNIKPKIYKVTSSDSEPEQQPKSRKNKLMELSVEEIKAQWKKYEQFKEKNRDLAQKARHWEEELKKDEQKEKDYEQRRHEKEDEKKKFIMKDCKNLTIPQLTDLFKKDMKWVDDIFHGRRHCERHEKFKVDTPSNKRTSNDLMYNVSCEVFTEDQLIHLVTLFRKKYDGGNVWKHSSYYWKVLLPEYCLKIFMRCHKMGLDKAMAYLNSIPVPIEKYFDVETDMN